MRLQTFKQGRRAVTCRLHLLHADDDDDEFKTVQCKLLTMILHSLRLLYTMQMFPSDILSHFLNIGQSSRFPKLLNLDGLMRKLLGRQYMKDGCHLSISKDSIRSTCSYKPMTSFNDYCIGMRARKSWRGKSVLRVP